ncbi:MAG: helix-turn-helix domain-containing protein [Oscillospiraceae bacterium]|jgi:transcriptional regulator with XRE-family HTH domain|nr:helix-turn-helix domain-containing protein [Oscillospiraceae bacterium]
MQIYFGENLKKLRREKDLTQEDLARFLNVSFQSVSKWERGETTPDIVTLPVIARYFGVTTDELLGVDKLDDEARKTEYYKRDREYSEGGHYEESVALFREAYRDFPNDYDIINQYAHRLYFRALATGNVAEDKDEIIALETRVLDECKDINARLLAIQTLCVTCVLAKDKESAKKYAELAPYISVTRGDLLLDILEGDELRKSAQSHIMTILQDFYISVITLNKCEYTTEERVHNYETVVKLFALVYEDGDFGWQSSFMWHIHMMLAHLYARTQNTEKTLENLDDALRFARAYDAMQMHALKSPLLNGYVVGTEFSIKNYTESDERLLRQHFAEPDFDFIRDDERFRRLSE